MTRNPTDAGTAEPESTWDSIFNGLDKEVVISGCALSKGAGDFDVDVASGEVFVAETAASVAAVTKTLTSPSNDADLDSGEWRVDILTVNSSGTVSVQEGTAAPEFPDAPDIPADEVCLGWVLVSGDATSLSSSDIHDRRVLSARPAEHAVALTGL